MKKIILTGVVLTVLILVVAFFALGENSVNTGNNTYTPTKTVEKDEVLLGFERQTDDSRFENGWVLFAMNGEGNVNATVDLHSVAIHSIFIDKWVLLQNVRNQLKVEETPVYTGHSELDSIDYNQIYLYIPKAQVYENGNPKNVLIFKDRIYMPGHAVTIVPNSTTYVQLTLIKNESFLKTTDGDYVFIPKFKLQVWLNATATVLSNDLVIFKNGTLWTDVTVGTDKDGNVDGGLGVASGDQLQIGNRTVTLA